MIAIQKPSNDPWFNLAAEEFVVKHIKDEVFMIWQNSDCVVIGKHQNTIAEVNTAFLSEKNIPVIRRISGGGTVFQGKGNLNYSFITNVSTETDKVNFIAFTQPIIDFLAQLGVVAELNGTSNLNINGLKFSGNAAHIHKNRVLHHGTLLFDADLDLISEAIKVSPAVYQSKAIQSNRVKIGNVKPTLKKQIDLNTFENQLKEFILTNKSIILSRDFTAYEQLEIEKLASEKYKSWEWNFGYSPDYKIEREVNLQDLSIKFTLKVHRGIITEINFDGLTEVNNQLLCSRLMGLSHRYSTINEALKKINDIEQILGKQLNQFTKHLF